jgi:hypothetical protein
MAAILGNASIIADSTTNIAAPSGEVYAINNIKHEGSIEIYQVTPDGTFQIDEDEGFGWLMNLSERVSDTIYLQIKDTSSATNKISWNGLELV